MATNLVIAGLPNFVAADVAAITAGADAGGTMGVANLKTQEPAEVARLTSVFPHESWWEVDLSVALPVEAVALVNHSLIPGDQVRVVGVASGALPPARSETLPPTAIEAIVNEQGAPVGVLDEHPSSPSDMGIALPTVETDPWSIRFSFGTPSFTPAVGGDYQCFLAKPRQVNAAESASDFPTGKASLYEGGVLRKVLGTKAINANSAEGQLLIFPWNAGDLQTADGSAVELLLEFEPGSGVAYAGLDSVSWEVMHQADVDAADFDTGWQTMIGAEAEAAWGGTALQAVDLPSPLWHHLMVATNLESLRVEFRADGLGFFTNFVATPPRTPSGVIDVGVLLVAALFEVEYNFAPGASLRSRPFLIGDDDGLDGANRAIAAYRRRTCEVEFLLVPEAEAHSLFARLDHASQGTAAFLLVLEPTKTGTIARNTTFWAIAAEARGLIYQEGFIDGEPIRSMAYAIEEKL
jgi:hypothetical protein